MPNETSQQLEERRAVLKRQLSDIGDMRPGSLVERYRRCGKANCHCSAPEADGHGPSWSLTRAVRGKTVTRIIPAASVDRTREQIEEYQRFRILIRELVEISERLCDARLRASEPDSGQEAAQKGGFRRSSKRRSSRKSSV